MLCTLAAVLAIAIAPPKIEVDSPHVIDGVTCEFQSCEAEAKVMVTTGGHRPGPRRELGISMHAQLSAPPGGLPMRVLGMEFTKLLAADGRDLLAEAKRPRREPQPPRGTELADAFNAAFMQRENYRMHCSDSLRGLPALPATIARATARVDVLAAGNVHREPIRLVRSEEAIEVVPGITFLLTRAEAEGQRFVISFEVRAKRFREGDPKPPGTEPIFGGLFLYRDNGEPLNVLRYGQEMETRDEMITVVREASFDPETIRAISKAEVIVFDGIKTMSFEVGISNFPITAESRPAETDKP